MSVDRSRLPALGASIDIRFPEVGRSRLANGLGVWSIERRDLPMLAVVALVETGSADDPEDRPGLSALAADLLDEGAGGRDAVAFHDALARLGGQIEIEPGQDATFVSMVGLSRGARHLVGLLADLLCAPLLAESDFARVRDLRLNRIAQFKDAPSALAERTFLTRLFGSHPYGHLPIGTEPALRAATLHEVGAFHASRYVPDRITLFVAGDIDRETMLAYAGEAFGRYWSSVPPRAAPPDVDAPPAPLSTPRIAIVDRPGAPQSELRVGRVSVPRSTPDYFPLVVLNAVLGGQFVSRINMNLREEKGYTYGARSGFDFRRGAGPFVVQASVQTDATAASVREILKELGDVRGTRPPTAAEIELAKASLTRGYARNFETVEQLARAAAQMCLYGLPHDYFDRYVGRVDAVESNALAAVAARWLDPADAAIVIVGDRARVEAPLADLRLGDIEAVPV